LPQCSQPGGLDSESELRLRDSAEIKSQADRQIERVGQLGLKLGFPGVAAIAVTAAGVGQNEKLARAGVAVEAFLLPPMGDGMSGKGGRVVGDTHDEGAAIFGDVVNAIGNGDPDGDSFTGTIAIASLAPGNYCIGIDANNPSDPAFSLTFNTPVGGATPEPSTFVLISVALGVIGCFAAQAGSGRSLEFHQLSESDA
jgi:hypothetical protein